MTTQVPRVSGATDHPAGERPFDPDEASTNTLNPLVPRPIDLPTELPLTPPAATGDAGTAPTLDPAVGDIAKIFAAPTNPAEWPAWRRALVDWRTEARERLNYSGAAYDDPRAGWAASCYSVSLVWLWDERLFDHGTQSFDVDRYLAATAHLGGFDAIVLWHAYPVIGIDDRNQFDFYRLVPGITELVAAFHDRGLRVFIDYNPWDTGTRRADHGDPDELAAIVAELGVDGVFLDTMKEGDSALVNALRATEPPQLLEGESRVPNQRIEDHQLSWAQWFADSEAPGVMRAHWYERRHMMHSTRRWNRDHGSELQSSWMNGVGMLVWDTVFGVWVGWNDRDAATLRSMVRVQRALSDVLVSGEWKPLVDATDEALAAGVYASRFELDGVTLWTLVNRGDSPFTGRALVPVTSDRDGERVFDVTTGVELDSGTITIPARGIAGIVAVTGDVPRRVLDLVAAAAADTDGVAARAAGASFPARTAERLVPTRSITRAPSATDATLSVTTIEPARNSIRVDYRQRETGLYGEAPYVEEWKPLPPRLHNSTSQTFDVAIGAVAVANREVTAAEFAEFVDQTGYRPTAANRFLDDCRLPAPGSGEATDSIAPDDAPAVGVSLDDARAYASWVGARLPTEFEWQLAAADPAFGRRTPLVWNLTESEHSDGITRFVILKGGSSYRATGSDWYVDGGERPPEFSLKFLLPGLGMERSPNIGFRLAWDGGAA